MAKPPYRFPTKAESISNELRAALGISILDPLDPFALASMLSVPTISLGELFSLPIAGDHMAVGETDAVRNNNGAFSAVTVERDGKRKVAYNDLHGPNRVRSDLAHELAHIICDHPMRPLFTHEGCRQWDDAYEAEAVYLAGALLVPKDGLLHMDRNGITLEQAADDYQVSLQLYRMRYNKCGVFAIRQRRLAKSN